MKHFVTHKYTDGTEITSEWSDLFDGPWKQKEDNITVEHKHPFFTQEQGKESN